MALFFDAEWFDAQLSASHLSRAHLARALGISDAELAELWTDQRELSARDVAILAALLNASAEDVAAHAGISTPVPHGGGDIMQRLSRIESGLAELKTLVLALRKDQP